MKKQVAIILSLAFVLSLTACGKGDTAKTNTDTTEPTVSAVTSTTSEPNTDDERECNGTASSDTAIDFSDVSSFDDFVEKMDESGFKTTETKTEDGIIVKLETPTTNTDDKTTTSTPAIPTIDVVVRPTEPTPTKPEKDKTSSEETSAPEKEEAVSDAKEKIRPAVKYIEAHCTEKIELQKLADMCFMSKSQLGRCFKSQYNTTPISYKNRFRIEKSKQMLLYGVLNTAQIAEKMGFDSVYSFSKIFKQYVGLTQTEFSKNKNKG